MRMMPPMRKKAEGVEKPKNLKDLPRYLKELLGGFFSRLFYIYGLVWETTPGLLFLMFFMAVFNGVTPIFSAMITRNLINALTVGTGEFQQVLRLLILQFGFLIVTRLIGTLDSTLTRSFSELVINNIKEKIMNKANELDLQSFDQPEFYEKLENANREAGHRPIQIIVSTFSLLSTLVSMTSFVIVMWKVSPLAPFLIVISAIPLAIVNYIYKGKNAAFMHHRSVDRRKMDYYSQILSDKDMAKEVRLFRLGDYFIDCYHKVFERYFSGMKKLIYGEGLWNVAATTFMNLINCGLFIWVAWKVWQGEQTIGDYTLYTSALNSIGAGVNQIIFMTASIYEGTLFINNMIAFMNEKRMITPSLPSAREVKRQDHEIEFRHVYFRYPAMTYDVLKDINLKFRSGESVVLVGLNGAGKTTLLKLMTRLYDPTQGEILLDGHDIREYDVQQLYDIYGTIFQDYGKYADTAAMNIAYGDIHQEFSMDLIRNAAEQGNAASVIEKLENGYDTQLERIFDINGAELSGGQWQKIAISRAFYNDSDILILDEPTASLDPLAEQEIYKQFEQLREGKLTFFVSHRLSNATTASKIVVLENGEVKEVGSHKELMAQNGSYHRLFSVQAERYLESVENDSQPEKTESSF